MKTYGISLANALKAAAKVRVFVSIQTPSPIMATAPKGNGVVIIPTIVPRKMDRRCHACWLIPSGTGQIHIKAPTPTQVPNFFRSAPHWMPGSSLCGGTLPVPDAAVLCGTRMRPVESGWCVLRRGPWLWWCSRRLTWAGRGADMVGRWVLHKGCGWLRRRKFEGEGDRRASEPDIWTAPRCPDSPSNQLKKRRRPGGTGHQLLGRAHVGLSGHPFMLSIK